MWLKNAVVYEVYVRSFQDSDGDGVGDLRGVIARLEHVRRLGAAALWLSPIFRSPNADYGYDVSDFTAVDPTLGTLADFDELVKQAHGLGLKVVLDFVPCHTSIEHRWFREHPDYYTWADAPPNNWRATFGGSAWKLDQRSGRYYLHSFYPEQADVDWRNPHLRDAMSAAMRFWLDRGIDGFRLDALDRLLKDEQLRDDPASNEPPALPMEPAHAELLHTHSRNAPDIGLALRAIREAAGDVALIGEVYLPTAQLGPYLETLDGAFAFELFHADPDARAIAGHIAAAIAAGKPAWVLSNHDFSRLGSRVGERNLRAMTLLLLSLPGPAFMFQGDELGMLDAPTTGPQLDRVGRDAFRRPLPWDPTPPAAGFTTGSPWLPVGDGVTASVTEQERDAGSQLQLTRRLIALRSGLGDELKLLEPAAPETVAFERGQHLVAVNLGDAARPAPAPASPIKELLIEARPGDGADLDVIPPHGGWIARLRRE